MQINVCQNDNCVRIYVYMRLHTQLARMETTAIPYVSSKYRNPLSGLPLDILSVSCPVASQIPYRNESGL